MSSFRKEFHNMIHEIYYWPGGDKGMITAARIVTMVGVLGTAVSVMLTPMAMSVKIQDMYLFIFRAMNTPEALLYIPTYTELLLMVLLFCAVTMIGLLVQAVENLRHIKHRLPKQMQPDPTNRTDADTP